MPRNALEVNDVIVDHIQTNKVEKDSLKAWGVLAAAWAFYFYEYILRVSAGVMTNDLMTEFGVTAGALGFLTSCYYIAYVPLQIPCGIIVDRLGPRRVVTFSALLCTLGAVIFGLTHNFFTAQVGRFLMGAGSACAYLSCTKIAGEWFSPARFAVIAGITMFMGTLGGSFGSRPFAVLVNMVGWRSAMLVSAFIGALVACYAWINIKDSSTRANQSRKLASVSNVSKVKFLDGLRLIASNSQSWLVALYGCMMYLPLSAVAELWGVPYLMQRFNVDNETASAGSIAVFVGMGLGCIVGSWISNLLQRRKIVMFSSAIATLFVFFAAFHIPSISLETMFLLLFLGGFVSGGQILYFAVATELAPPHLSATAVGFTNAGVMSSAMVFQPLLGYILDFVWKGDFNPDGTRFYDLEDYTSALSAVLVALLIGCLIVFFIKETYPTEAFSKTKKNT